LVASGVELETIDIIERVECMGGHVRRAAGYREPSSLTFFVVLRVDQHHRG